MMGLSHRLQAPPPIGTLAYRHRSRNRGYPTLHSESGVQGDPPLPSSRVF